MVAESFSPAIPPRASWTRARNCWGESGDHRKYKSALVGSAEERTLKEFIIPLYLNQRIVFDILAMMDDGLAEFETIKTTQVDGNDQSGKVSGEIGVKNAFAFLGVNLGGAREKSTHRSGTEEITKQKFHTPNSLFSKVRERLTDSDLIYSAEKLGKASMGFIETKVTLRKNPFVDALESMKSLLELAVAFDDSANQKGKKQNVNPNRNLIGGVESLLKQIRAEGSFDLIGNTIGNPIINVVVTMDGNFVGDPSLSDIIDGEYFVLGKVSKFVENSSMDGINLLRKTSMGKLQNKVIDEVKAAFSGMDEHGINMPEIITTIDGPVVQIVPIAIYL